MNTFVIEKEFMASGLRCVVMRMDIGHRCGYVAVEKSSPAYGMHCDDVSVSVHGGLTFAEKTLFGVKKNGDVWWLGFDCAHYGDTAEIWTTERVVKETKALAKQLRAVSWDKMVAKRLEQQPLWFRKRVVMRRLNE